MDPFFKNSLLFRKKTFGSMLDPQRKTGVVCNTESLSDYSVFVLDHKMSFFIRFGLVMMVWEDVLNSSSLYPFYSACEPLDGVLNGG